MQELQRNYPIAIVYFQKAMERARKLEWKGIFRHGRMEQAKNQPLR